MHTIRRCRHALSWTLGTLVLVAASVGATPARAATLERQMVRRAPEVIRYLKSNGYRNVGVLKFLVTKDGKSFSDNVGTLNMTLARQLEVALVLANNPTEPLGIVHNASAVAVRTPGANHLSRAGREKLFGAQYPLAWGNAEVSVDAFVTGTAEVSKDLSTLTISLFVFDRARNKLVQLGEDFTARNDATKLGEMGESFVLRGAFDEGKVEPAAQETLQNHAVQTAAEVKTAKVQFPLAEKTPPAQVEVYYDGRPVPIEFRDGKAYIPEPREGQKVTLVLSRDSSRERYGVVLKVNGENTFQRETLPDLHCHKWILDPGCPRYTIGGFQLDDKTAEAFRVQSREESRENEIKYGADVGTITLTVFREWTGREPAPEVGKKDEYAKESAVHKAELPANKETYSALKAQLLADANRGWISPGEKVGSEVKRVEFKANPVPVLSATIVYYRP